MRIDRLEKLKEMEAKMPGDAFVKYAIAQEFTAMEKYEEALAYYTLLLEKFPDYLPTYYQLGKLYEAMNENAKALFAFTQGIIVAKQQNEQKTLRELNEAIALLE